MGLNLKFKSGNSLVYSIVKTLSFFCIQLFYKNTYFKGIINIPKNAGILFAPNHQSAFLDALMVSQMLPSQNRFLIRADIFKGKLVKKILSSLNLLPIYRLSDGKKNMDNNEAIFLAAEESLLRKETIVIFFCFQYLLTFSSKIA